MVRDMQQCGCHAAADTRLEWTSRKQQNEDRQAYHTPLGTAPHPNISQHASAQLRLQHGRQRTEAGLLDVLRQLQARKQLAAVRGKPAQLQQALIGCRCRRLGGRSGAACPGPLPLGLERQLLDGRCQEGSHLLQAANAPAGMWVRPQVVNGCTAGGL